MMAALACASGEARAATCTAEQKAAAEQALAAYQKSMAKAKASYFKTHRKPAQRKAFVAKQQAKLRALRTAASCVVPNQRPIAVLSPAATSVTIGDALSFDASKSVDPDGTIVSYQWAFGDGATASAATASHTYLQPGSFSVTLTVTDDDGATATATATIAAARPTTTVFEFHYGAGVGDADKAAVEAGAYASGRVLDRLGHSLMQTPIFVETDVRALAADFVSLYGGTVDQVVTWMQNTSASAGLHGVFLLVSHSDWQTVPAGERPITTAHETFHVAQNERFLSSPLGSAGGADGALWLHEGAAEWWGCYTAGQAGVDQRRANYARIVRENPGLTLASVEPQSAGNPAYGFGFIAVDRLVALRGVESLFEFWRLAGSGVPWRDAFAQAFGMSVDSFYADFEAYRRTL